MVSPTQQTMSIRRRKQTTNGKWNKKTNRAVTPKFPVHPEGYDPSAADARRPENPNKA